MKRGAPREVSFVVVVAAVRVARWEVYIARLEALRFAELAAES